MTRGERLGIKEDAEVAQRAKRMIGYVVPLHPKSPPDAIPLPIAYRLTPGHNGGFDPHAEHCASWSYGYRVPTSDCVGLWAWANGIDRFQREFPQYGGWINCTSLGLEAKKPKSEWVEIVDKPFVGATIVYVSDPSSGLRHGHIGTVTALLPGAIGDRWVDFTKVLVTHCAAHFLRRGRPLAPAIRETTAAVWKKRGVFVRLKKR